MKKYLKEETYSLYMQKQVNLTELEPGDKVLWGNRQEPMTVTNVSFDGSLKFAELESNRGKGYMLRFNEMAGGSIEKPEIGPRHRARDKVAKDLRVVE